MPDWFVDFLTGISMNAANDKLCITQEKLEG